MTCIAWDGKTLAADRLAHHGGSSSEIQKIWSIETPAGAALIGGAGNAPLIREMVEWVRGGSKPKKFPPAQRVEDGWASIIVVWEQGSPVLYENNPYPIVLASKCIAIGSGREYARAAMYLGKTAREAVEVAMALCVYCGLGIDELSHGPIGLQR